MPGLLLSRRTCEWPAEAVPAGQVPGLTFRSYRPSYPLRLWKETTMDTTVTGIGSVVVAELRAAGYLESTIGQYARTIKVLARFAAGRGSGHKPGPGGGGAPAAA